MTGCDYDHDYDDADSTVRWWTGLSLVDTALYPLVFV